MAHFIITPEIQLCFQQITDYSKLSYQRGLVTAAGGNVSMRCGEYVLITASGISLRDTQPCNLIVCDLMGNVLVNDSGHKPSKELKIHLDIYRLRPDIDTVIHVHPPFAVAYTYQGKEIPMATGSAEMKLKHIPIVPYAWPGSGTLADAVAQTVQGAQKNVQCIVLQRHGIVAYEKGISSCFDVAELTEDTARIALLAGI